MTLPGDLLFRRNSGEVYEKCLLLPEGDLQGISLKAGRGYPALELGIQFLYFPIGAFRAPRDEAQIGAFFEHDLVIDDRVMVRDKPLSIIAT